MTGHLWRAFLFSVVFMMANSGCGSSSVGPTETNITRTIELLENLDWDTTTPESVDVAPPGGLEALTKDPVFARQVSEINHFALFGDWFYGCLPEDSDAKRYLEYFMGSAYVSEDFIWNQRGLLQFGYEVGLPVVRGAEWFIPEASSWSAASERGRQFPVLNSAAADSVIALVMREFDTDSCAIGFGQWQQNFVSGSILSMPWSLPVNTDQNPVVFQDENPPEGRGKVPNVDRHKFVLGPITWLSMALDVRAWDRESDKSVFRSSIERGRGMWESVNDNIEANEALCKKFALGGADLSRYPKVVVELVTALMTELCMKPKVCVPEESLQALVRTTARILEKELCNASGSSWDYMTYDAGTAALLEAQGFLEDRSTPKQGPSVEAINAAATTVQRFYFGEDLGKRPFRQPLVSPVSPPVVELGG